jgi:hypothetical protein
MSREHGPQVALLGAFDVADYGELLAARIYERELLARLPLSRVDQYAPLGAGSPIALDGGRPALALGPPEPSRKSELANRHHLLVVTGDVMHVQDVLYARRYGISDAEAERLRPSGFFIDGLGPELQRCCPVVWSGVTVPFELDSTEQQRVRSALGGASHVSVLDAVSQERLVAARPSAEVRFVSHAAVLAARLYSPDVLRKRLDYLRVMEWYPAERRPIVVQLESAGGAARLAADLASLETPVVLVGLKPGSDSGAGADVPASLLPERPFRLPTNVGIEDVAAAIANAAAFVGSSTAGRATALAFGVPSVGPNAVAQEAPAEIDASRRGELQASADGEFDDLAAIAEHAWAARATSDPQTAGDLLRSLGQAEERYQALLRAYEQRGERLVQERLRFAEIVNGLEAAGSGLSPTSVSRAAELETQLEIVHAAEAEARFELESLKRRTTKRG